MFEKAIFWGKNCSCKEMYNFQFKNELKIEKIENFDFCVNIER